MVIILQSGADVNETDSDGRTALHFAAQSGFCLSPLLQAGCDVDILPNDGSVNFIARMLQLLK